MIMRWPPWKKSVNVNTDVIPAQDPFLAKPLVVPGVEFGRDSLGLIQIRRHIEPKGRLTRTMSRLFKMNYAPRVNLDRPGSSFLALIDGRRTLGEIAAEMEREFSWSVAQSRHATIEFTATLMKRGVIALQVNRAGQAGCADAESLSKLNKMG